MARDITDVRQIASRRKRNRLIYFATLAVLACATVLVAALLLILRTPIFRVQEVRIEGGTRIPEEEVRTFLRAKVPGEGFIGRLLGARTILVWPDGFEREELSLLPEVKAITIEKHYFRRRVAATVVAAERKGIWCFRSSEDGKCFWFDEEGRLLRRVPRTSGNLIQVVDDYSQAGVAPGTPALPPRLFQNMASILLAVQRAPIDIREIRLEDLGLEEVRIVTSGPDLLMSLRFPSPDLRAALEALEKTTAIGGLEYLDFRVEKRVYYR